MQLFSKKSSSHGEETAYSAWHPDFRDVRQLPDTKTVRTKFFINAAALFVAVCLALYFVYNEYSVSALRAQLADLNRTIDAATPSNKQAVTLFDKYKAEEARIQEVAAFLSLDQVTLSDFVYDLGQSLPEYVTITSLTYRESDIVLKGTIKGAEQASTIASNYVKQLKENSAFSKSFVSVSMTSLSRDASSGLFNLEVSLKFKK